MIDEIGASRDRNPFTSMNTAIDPECLFVVAFGTNLKAKWTAEKSID